MEIKMKMIRNLNQTIQESQKFNRNLKLENNESDLQNKRNSLIVKAHTNPMQ